VSPAAPIATSRPRCAARHVARRGFEEFGAALAKAWDEGKPDVMTAFDRWAKPISPSPSTSRLIIRRCFEAGVALDSDAICVKRARMQFAVLRAASEKLVARCRRKAAALADGGVARGGR